MIFKRMEAFGFKSFADKIDIPLNEGVTAIVGPNGCGKSNVVDAIRWVLGEQSTKVLRGKSYTAQVTASILSTALPASSKQYRR